MSDGVAHPAFTDGSHVLVAGISGSGDRFGGKTSTCSWLVDHLVPDHFDFGVCFSPKGHNFPGPTVTTAPDAADAVASGARVVEWSVSGSPFDVDDLDERHAEAMDFADGLDGSVVAIHDDAAGYAGSDSLAWATSMAGNPASGDDPIKSLVVTQDPWDLPRRSVRTNLPTVVWVGPLSSEGEKFFRQNGLSDVVEPIRERHSVPYRWSVIDPDGRVTSFRPVDESYA